MKKFLFFAIIVLAVILRIYQIGENPPSLTWDEASLGYNAYTILSSGYDEHGEFLPLSRFIAFGDYKPPGYIYAAVLSLAIFGLNERSVRFPSVFAGIGMVFFTYLLVKEIFKKKKLAFLASFFLAVSSWSLFFSRAAYESHLAAFFNLLGVYFFFLSFRKKWGILFSVLFFFLSFYTFNANKIIAPCLFFTLFFLEFRQVIQNKKWLVFSFFLGFVLILPSLNYLQTRESRLRFQEVSIFNNLEPIKISNQRRLIDGETWWSRVIHNRRLLFFWDFLKHYSDNFRLRFLFTHGDVNPRLAVQTMGQLYVWDLPFFLLGIYWLAKKREKGFWPLIFWMLIVPIPAGMARETPHALRILSILPTYQIIIAYGCYQFITNFRRNTLINVYSLAILSSLFLSFNVFYYLHDYYIHFPRDWSGEWQYGYKQMVEYVSKNQDKYDHIFVTEALGRPYIFFAFYQKMPLEKFYENRIAERDWFGFWNVQALGKIRFGFGKISSTQGKILLVTTSENLPSEFHFLTSIDNPVGEKVFLIAEKI